MKLSGVYKITIGKYYYFGSSRDIHKRISGHLLLLRKQGHGNQFMQKVFSKNSRGFRSEIICERPVISMIEEEQKYITLHFQDRNCMNISPNAKDAFCFPENYARLAERNRTRVWTVEDRQKLSQKNLGMKRSKEHKLKLSLMRRGFLNSNSKLSQAQTNEIVSLRKAGVLVDDLADRFKVHPSTIQRLVCKHKIHSHPKTWTAKQRKAVLAGRDSNPNWCKNRHTKGSLNGRSILTESDVLKIKTMRSNGMTCSDIWRKKFSHVKLGTIEAISSGRNWAHVEPCLLAEYGRRERL